MVEVLPARAETQRLQLSVAETLFPQETPLFETDAYRAVYKSALNELLLAEMSFAGVASKLWQKPDKEYGAWFRFHDALISCFENGQRQTDCFSVEATERAWRFMYIKNVPKHKMRRNTRDFYYISSQQRARTGLLEYYPFRQ
ncbi:MAG: hypothetical protein M1607_01265 [Patescibacteria group bacterium]|nr:hypothetical protein [Patescibacteria group bacterium]